MVVMTPHLQAFGLEPAFSILSPKPLSESGLAQLLAEIDAPRADLRRRIVLTRRHDWRPTPLQADLVRTAHVLSRSRDADLI